MARETKVGLVVGLGFIFCLAVIISNRGAVHGSVQRYVYKTDPDGAQRSSLATASRSQERVRSYVDTALSGGRPAARTSGDRRNSPVTAAGDSPTLAGGASDSASHRNAPPDEASAEGAHRTSDDRANQRASADDPPLDDGGQRRHTIAKGDTLSRISQKYYGSKAKRYVDAIVAANPDVLKDANVLHAGQELILPNVDAQRVASPQPAQSEHAPRRENERDDRPPAEAQPPAPADPPPKASPGKPPKKSPKKGEPRDEWKWYQVKPGDRYASIAQAKLGDRNRWSEIHELNKNVFSDPSKIKAGVRIRLPGDGT